jgi:hypothetical protein
VNAGILLACLIGQEHSVYRDIIVFWGKSGSEQPTVLGVLGILHVLDELPDCDLFLLSNRPRIHRSILSARATPTANARCGRLGHFRLLERDTGHLERRFTML